MQSHHDELRWGMSVQERRQHFRIDDHIYFEYKILKPGNCYTSETIKSDLLGEGEQRYLETMRYFKTLDYELSEITKTLALKEPTIAHYLNLINAKIDYLARHLTLDNKTPLRKVNISLGGMAFHTTEPLEEKAELKIALYTKPKMIPIIIHAEVIACKMLGLKSYRTSIQFVHLTKDQEQLLSRHMMLVQTPGRGS